MSNSTRKSNYVYIVGELVEVKNFRQGVDRNGKDYVQADIVVKSVVEGQELILECHNYTSKLTKANVENKNYKTICNLQALVGKRVVVSGGTLDSSRFWSARDNQIGNSTKINFNVIREANMKDNADTASFEYTGFVVRPIREVNDKDGNLICYEISLGQANYKKTNMSIVKFTIDKDNVAAVRFVEQQYVQGATVFIRGLCRTIITQTEKTEDVAFGQPITRTYTNVSKKYVIVNGSAPLTPEDSDNYSPELIDSLVAAYKAEAATIQATAQEPAATTDNKIVKAKSNASSLSGLL